MSDESRLPPGWRSAGYREPEPPPEPSVLDPIRGTAVDPDTDLFQDWQRTRPYEPSGSRRAIDTLVRHVFQAPEPVRQLARRVAEHPLATKVLEAEIGPISTAIAKAAGYEPKGFVEGAVPAAAEMASPFNVAATAAGAGPLTRAVGPAATALRAAVAGGGGFLAGMSAPEAVEGVREGDWKRAAAGAGMTAASLLDVLPFAMGPRGPAPRPAPAGEFQPTVFERSPGVSGSGVGNQVDFPRTRFETAPGRGEPFDWMREPAGQFPPVRAELPPAPPEPAGPAPRPPVPPEPPPAAPEGVFTARERATMRKMGFTDALIDDLERRGTVTEPGRPAVVPPESVTPPVTPREAAPAPDVELENMLRQVEQQVGPEVPYDPRDPMVEVARQVETPQTVEEAARAELADFNRRLQAGEPMGTPGRATGVVESPRAEAGPGADVRSVPLEPGQAPGGGMEPRRSGRRGPVGGRTRPPAPEAPGLLPSPAEGRAEGLARQLFDDARANGFTGTEDEFRALFDDRLAAARSLQQDLAALEGEHGPQSLLEAVAERGGLRLDPNDPFHGEIAALWEASKRGNVNATTKGGRAWTRRLPTADLGGISRVLRQGGGRSLDDLAEGLRQDPRFAHIADPQTLLKEIEQALVNVERPAGIPNLEQALAATGVRPGERWWAPGEDLSAIEDFLSTGEAQPRLPGDVGAVRQTEVPTPEFEAPYALTPEAAQPTGVQPTLREAPPPADLTLDELARQFEEIDQPAKLRRIAERRGKAVTQKRYEPGPADLRAESERILAGKSDEEILKAVGEGGLVRGGEFRTPEGKPREIGRNPRAMGTNPRQMEARAQRMAQLLDEPTPENLDEYARLLGEQADRFNETQMRGGTGKAAKAPPRHGTGEYLAAGFAGFDKLYHDNPVLFWRLMRGAGGGLVGALVNRERGEDPLVGAAIGIGAGLAGPAIWRQLAARAPSAFRALKTTFDKAEAGVPEIRRARPEGKDINALELAMGLPERTTKAWKRISPVLDELAEAEATMPPNATERFKRFTRQMYMEEALAEMKDLIGEADRSGNKFAAAYLRSLDKAVRGVPTWPAKATEFATRGIVSARTADKAINTVTNHVYRTLLGWDSAVANLTQPILAYPYTGARALVKGYQALRTPAGKKATEFLKLRRPSDAPTDIKAAHKAIQKWYDLQGSGAMTATDSLNRRATYLAALYYGRKRGLTPPQAHEWASELTAVTQSVPGVLGFNPFHRHFGPLRAFVKFPTLWAQWAYDVATHPNPSVRRRGIGLLAGAGIGSLVTGINLVNFLIPRLSISLPALKGGKDLYEHWKGTATHDLSEDVPGAVVGRYATKVYREAKDFARYGTGVHPEFSATGEPTGWHYASEGLGNLAGVQTTRQTEARAVRDEAFQFIDDAVRQRARVSRRAKRSVLDAIRSGDYAGAAEAAAELTPAQRRDFQRRYKMTPYQALVRRVPKNKRAEFERRFGPQLRGER